MSDSDDDWFDKDIEDFKVDLPKDNSEKIEFLNDESLSSGGPNFFESDYGGNYNKSTQKSSNQSGSDKSTNNSSSAKHILPISFKKLSFILELTPLNVFLEILQPDSGFIETINKATISSDVMGLTLKAIGMILSLPLSEHKRCFLQKIIEAKTYWKQIEGYMKELTIEQKPGKSKKKLIVATSDQEFWENLVVLCWNVTKFFEWDGKFVQKAAKMIVDSKHELKLNAFKEEFDKMFKKITDESSSTFNEIYPTLEELVSTEPVDIKPNIVEGKYPSVTHYLDVHLSLLREDFICPLREGIIQFLSQAKDGSYKSNNNIKVYPKVQILTKCAATSSRGHKGEFLMVDLDPEKNDARQRENFSNFSKKLMYGSLVVFTTSIEFKDMILAVVSNRDTDLLNQGFIQIEIIKSFNVPLVFERDFIMFESEVYFEPYHHVYNVMKNFDDETFPMKNYIIDVDVNPTYPSYIPPTTKTIYTHRKYALDLKNTSAWPSAAALKLNDSQLSAFKNSLTNKFSVIQGPPGTGKTFVGLEILTALIRNTDEQILVICYTNHALDQFLAGVLAITQDIVRMGNQSKNELLDKFNVKQLLETVVSDKRMKNCFYKAKCEYAELMEQFEALQGKKGSENDAKSVEAEILAVQDKLRSISRKQEELKQINEFNLLKSKRVIGMTSTCAARSNTLLHMLKPPIVFIEEAAEILEPHIIAALSNETQHLILIGDHKQLRPTTSVYKLAKQYKMDISLFERMVNNGINSVKLNVQHRMRPEIANLIRPTIYKELTDHELVAKYPNVLGITKNVFFITHNELETNESDETSKKNVFEAQYLVALCNYFILQGYPPEDVTILTMYNGQIFQFSQERRKYPNLKRVRITVVDNYQGEESKIILLSLVRSNNDDKIGYLSLKNRICVALSRAKHGFYMIGNMNLLAKNSATWKLISKELQEQDAIGETLCLCCQTHGNISKIRAPSDFDRVKFGGCSDTCSIELSCGHQCSYFCHTKMFDHYSNCDCTK